MWAGAMAPPIIHAAAAWHLRRRRAILDAHPDIRSLGGHNPWTAALVFLVSGAHFAVAAALRDAPWYVIGAGAYLFGAVFAHALGMLIHECAHNLIVRSSAGNKALSIAANLPLVLPAAIDFRYKHLLHHKHLGEGEHRDFQVPVSRGAAWVGGSRVRKVIWLAVGSLLFPRGHVEDAPEGRDRWDIANIVAEVVVLVPFTLAFGSGALAYLALSGLFAFGPHPLGVRGYGEHLAAHAGQPTTSYYGMFNLVSFNVGHHVEHHDFPAVPWNRLPRVRRYAPEHYRALSTIDSWVGMFARYVFSPAVKVDCYASAEAFAERAEETRPLSLLPKIGDPPDGPARSTRISAPEARIEGHAAR
jgi:sphingolipid 4-desaturase/C4-monooxygenase